MLCKLKNKFLWLQVETKTIFFLICLDADDTFILIIICKCLSFSNIMIANTNFFLSSLIDGMMELFSILIGAQHKYCMLNFFQMYTCKLYCYFKDFFLEKKALLNCYNLNLRWGDIPNTNTSFFRGLTEYPTRSWSNEIMKLK